MNYWSRAIVDIKEGNNIDSYATIIAASIAVILSLFSLVSNEIVFAILLATLALISLSQIKHRFLLEDIISNIASKGKICESFPTHFENKIRNANEIWLIGVHHSSFMNEHYNSLTNMLDNGGKLSVILATSHGEAIKMTSLRFPGGVDPVQEQKRTEENLKLFNNLKNQYPQNVKIKTIDYLFEYSCVFVDGNSSDGEAFLQRYTFRTKGGANKPKIVYKPTDGDWYTLIRSEFLAFWKC
ncbi:MAG: hypothetical protein HF982_15115 [Desulfobacteraceae bacterium]|nr:hypothetical protein [Desulfobacteraceae bacterium]MBC2720886.1 hypothetical protein [Desulfobacteraceae bacterium]